MSDFIAVVGGHGLEHINLDLVRWTTEDIDGNITLHFDATDMRKLEGQNAIHFRNEFDRRWRGKVKAANAA